MKTMYKLTDGRDKTFELVADLEGIKEYLGEGFEECEDHFDIQWKLDVENDGMAGYQIEEI